MENNTELRDNILLKLMPELDTINDAFISGWNNAYESMDKETADVIKSFSKVVEQMKKENAKLQKKIQELEAGMQEVEETYIKPLQAYAEERPKNSVFKVGQSITQETINRAKAFDLIKELLK